MRRARRVHGMTARPAAKRAARWLPRRQRPGQWRRLRKTGIGARGDGHWPQDTQAMPESPASVFTQSGGLQMAQPEGPWPQASSCAAIRQDLPANEPRKSLAP